MQDNQVLKPGTVALVTGASRGIGRAVTERLLGRGLRVICLARNLALLEAHFSTSAQSMLNVSLDITDADAVERFFQTLPEEWKSIDIAVLNAGSDIGGRQHFVDGTATDWQSTVDTNVNGLMRMCLGVLPGMLAREFGHVLNVGSIAGYAPYDGGAVYSATKHAVRAFTEALRKEHKHSPVRISEVLPGLVRTGFAQARFHGDAERAEEYYDSFPAALSADDVAESVMFILSQPAHINIAQLMLTPTGDK